MPNSLNSTSTSASIEYKCFDQSARVFLNWVIYGYILPIHLVSKIIDDLQKLKQLTDHLAKDKKISKAKNKPALTIESLVKEMDVVLGVTKLIGQTSMVKLLMKPQVRSILGVRYLSLLLIFSRNLLLNRCMPVSKTLLLE